LDNESTIETGEAGSREPLAPPFDFATGANQNRQEIDHNGPV
jgi:hypothetical protein